MIYHKQPSKASFSTINLKTFLHSYILIKERFVIDHKDFIHIVLL